MPLAAFSRKIITVLFLVLTTSGCVLSHTEKPVTIEFRDRDTNEPLHGVHLRIIFNPTMVLNPPPTLDVSDISHEINIQLPDYDGMSYWMVQAPQYEDYRIETFGNERIPKEVKTAEDRAVVSMAPRQEALE